MWMIRMRLFFFLKDFVVYLKAGNSIREDFKITHEVRLYWIRSNENQLGPRNSQMIYESEIDNSMDEEGEVKKNGIKDEHSDGEIVHESLFEDGELENNHVDGIFSKKEKEVSEDPFNLYSLLKRRIKLVIKATNSEDSFEHPPVEAGDVDKLKGSANGSISAGHFKVSEIPRTGGSMVGLLEDVIKVGQVMGFKMEGVIANLENSLEHKRGKKVIDEFSIFKYTGLAQKSRKIGVTVSDYFVITRGKWRLTGKNMMIIGVYAPQEGKEKQALWDFLRFEVDKWNGDVIIMGDFNEDIMIDIEVVYQEELKMLSIGGSKFFNGHESSGKKASWVQWKKALAPKDNGGLGIFSLYALNRGLIFKWVWRFLAHEPTLWSRVIKAIHGANGKIDEISGKGANSCWINIIKEVRRLEEKGINCFCNEGRIGKWPLDFIWDDVWCDGGKLRIDF
ncbi:RNA-directed DNA polymerase, eukaryota [Tanacetum coccineum]|uniref:RNA-directed DNA polymerase, eukaryota n=1 Tax=Tanacetum coccineum TaxID=301880 RepID=A0ABQ5HNK0_9ASTR